MDVRQDSPGPTYVRPSRRVDTRSTYRGWLLHRGVSRQVPLGLNATLTRKIVTSQNDAHVSSPSSSWCFRSRAS